MQTETFMGFLKDNRMPVLNLDDAVKIIHKPRRYTSLFLQRLVAKGRLGRAIKSWYYVKGGSNEYEIASRIISPSYISLISALSYYGLTTQIPNILYVISPKKHKRITGIEGLEIVFKRIKPKMMFGYHKESGGNIFIADPEKAVVDIFYFNDVNDLDYSVLEKPSRIDIPKLVSYAIRSCNPSVLNGVSQMLKEHGYPAEARKVRAKAEALQLKVVK